MKSRRRDDSARHLAFVAAAKSNEAAEGELRWEARLKAVVKTERKLGQ